VPILREAIDAAERLDGVQREYLRVMFGDSSASLSGSTITAGPNATPSKPRTIRSGAKPDSNSPKPSPGPWSSRGRAISSLHAKP